MRKALLFMSASMLIVFVLPVSIVTGAFGASDGIPPNKMTTIEKILGDEAQYEMGRHLRHANKANIEMTIVKLTIDKIKKKEVDGVTSYSTQGQVSFKLVFKANAYDMSGIIIRKNGDTEETSAWFRCEVHENEYGDLSISRRPKMFFLHWTDPAAYETKPSN